MDFFFVNTFLRKILPLYCRGIILLLYFSFSNFKISKLRNWELGNMAFICCCCYCCCCRWCCYFVFVFVCTIYHVFVMMQKEFVDCNLRFYLHVFIATSCNFKSSFNLHVLRQLDSMSLLLLLHKIKQIEKRSQ